MLVINEITWRTERKHRTYTFELHSTSDVRIFEFTDKIENSDGYVMIDGEYYRCKGYGTMSDYSTGKTVFYINV